MRCWTIWWMIAMMSAASGVHSLAASGPVVWTAPATLKVFRDTPPGNDRSLALQAARNEYECGQVVIRAGEDALRGVRVTVTPLRGPGGRVIPAGNIECRLVGYVLVRHQNRYWPDPLPPLRPFDVSPGENQPVWVTVRVPKNAPAGRYSGRITLQPKGQRPSRVPVSLQVWDFAVPDKPSCETAFGIWDTYVYPHEGVQPGTPEAQAMLRRYYWFLVEHRISPLSIPVDVLSDEAAQFLDDPRVTSFVLPYSDDVNEMRRRVERAREKGWLPKAYFYPWDEPVNEEQYSQLKTRVEKIRSVWPEARIVSPFFRSPSFSRETAYEALDGLINIWCAVSAYYDPAKQAIKKLRGGWSWWYVCCGPGEPYANFHLTMDAMDHRILQWQQKRYGCDGLLYWATTYWNPSSTPDPWEDMATVKDINKNLYGDGSLLYPGKKVGHNGPVSSLRLELIREGFEDYEYLCLLERVAGRQAAEAAINELVTDMTHFSKDPVKLAQVRASVAEAIVSALKRRACAP